MSDRERVNAEARELYPAALPYNRDFETAMRNREAYVRAKIITAEQVETAAKALWGRRPFAEVLEAGWSEWSRENPNAAETWRDEVRATLESAGLLIEGDDHD